MTTRRVSLGRPRCSYVDASYPPSPALKSLPVAATALSLSLSELRVTPAGRTVKVLAHSPYGEHI